jgi:hypothetical protein
VQFVGWSGVRFEAMELGILGFNYFIGFIGVFCVVRDKSFTLMARR